MSPPNPSAPGREFAVLIGRFTEFRLSIARLAGTGTPGRADSPDGTVTAAVLRELDGWAACLDAAHEAAARAPETDRLLTRVWHTRLVEIATDARDALGRTAAAAPGSIGRHDTAFSVSGVAKSAAQSIARAARNRASRPRRLGR